MKKLKVFTLIVFILLLFGCAAKNITLNKNVNEKTNNSVSNNNLNTNQVVDNNQAPDPLADWETYTNAKDGYEIKYPNGWFLENGLLSPQKIEYYEIGSNNAPISFGLYAEDRLGKYNYQIKNSQRNNPDSSLIINGLTFKRYDLIDYRRYEGDTAGNVILLMGPKIKDQDRFIVFEWQQFPGGQTLKSNQPKDFIDIASTFKIIE